VTDEFQTKIRSRSGERPKIGGGGGERELQDLLTSLPAETISKAQLNSEYRCQWRKIGRSQKIKIPRWKGKKFGRRGRKAEVGKRRESIASNSALESGSTKNQQDNHNRALPPARTPSPRDLEPAQGKKNQKEGKKKKKTTQRSNKPVMTENSTGTVQHSEVANSRRNHAAGKSFCQTRHNVKEKGKGRDDEGKEQALERPYVPQRHSAPARAERKKS